MRLEFIDRVRENEVLGKNILTNDGKILLRAGVQLTSRYIEKLKELGVFFVYIEDDRLEDVKIEDDRLLRLKQATISNMSNIIKNIHSCNNKDVKDSLKIIEDLVDYIIDMGDVNKSLYDIQTFDNYTFVHSLDTCIMSSFLGLSYGFSEKELKDLAVGAILHDIGKVKISNKIINKTGPLTDEEYEEIKKHPIYGGEILSKNIRISENVIKAVLQHHERVDGKGYPYNLNGEDISKFGKIVCICDVYDAVSNDRVYRKKFSPNEAYELILSGSGTAFDNSIVKSFRETFAVYPLGCCVKLSNSIEGYVIRQNRNFPDRPVIRVLYDRETKLPIPFYEIDLLEHTSLVIESIVC
ncbi:HD-GYP domain-containing protein [Clostridium sp. SYSU_GA19001]|uniref:HD-GYP domain-containing protein n=1 Tax=Clostridium caldaquaticum TaxID=2940653 RepID=UPI002077485A|nr:HD-GYP domain-containing protein [Clostridium caldaquaticum]MCM8711162.1 HD-GYP domain-containing protein [Clostridium caldaquaticum]